MTMSKGSAQGAGTNHGAAPGAGEVTETVSGAPLEAGESATPASDRLPESGTGTRRADIAAEKKAETAPAGIPLSNESANADVVYELRTPRLRILPMLFLAGIAGAVIGAALVGYGAREGWIDTGISSATDELDARVESIETRQAEIGREIAALREAEPDISEMEAGMTGIESETARNAKRIETLVGDLEAMDSEIEAISLIVDDLEGRTIERESVLASRLDSLTGRVDELSQRPFPEAALPAAIAEAYERRLEEMQEVLDARFAELQTELDDQVAEINNARTAAEEAARAAESSARDRSALADIMMALDSGDPFSEHVAVLRENADFVISPALAENAETGVPTLDNLREEFVASARAALEATVQAGVEEGSIDPLEGFLRVQFGARSLKPREGGDADAALSRAEAALRESNLDGALAEIANLPDAAATEMASWTVKAEIRRDALAAAAETAASMVPN